VCVRLNRLVATLNPLILTVCMVALFGVLGFTAFKTLGIGSSVPTRQEFAREWAPVLLDAGSSLSSEGDQWPRAQDGIFFRQFENGEWVTGRAVDDEYSHLPDRQAIDVTVLADSRGDVFIIDGYHVCGAAMLGHDLDESAVEADGLDEFYAALEAPPYPQLELEPWNPVD